MLKFTEVAICEKCTLQPCSTDCFDRCFLCLIAENMVQTNDEGARTLWCGNINDQVTEELLYELFLQVCACA